MKKLLVAATVATLFLSSCTGECDTSTAEGAANCQCELTNEAEFVDQTDDAKSKELSDKIIKLNIEIGKAIEAGNYTYEEFTEIVGDRNCM